MRLRNLFCLIIIIIIIRYRDVLDFQNLKMAAVRHLEILKLTFGSRALQALIVGPTCQSS